MRRTTRVVGLGVLAAGLAGCLHTPTPWSPDGAWIAYTVAVRAPEPAEDLGYLFDPKRPVRLARPGSIAAYRLWATRPATGASVLLDESTGPITAPGWSQDGRALAFGRVATDGAGANRFEVVVMEGLTQRRVVRSEPIAALDGEVSRLPNQAIVWSADGRYLAAPHLEPKGLAIVQARTGRVVQVIPEGFLPAWAPSGARLAFFNRTAEGATLQVLDSEQGSPRTLLDVGQAGQAPVWGRDGASLLVVARRAGLVVGQRPGGLLRDPTPAVDPINLVRVRIDTGATEDLVTLHPDGSPATKPGPVQGVSVTADREGENLFVAVAIENQGHQVTWSRLGNNETVRRFPLVDPILPVGSLALAPDGQTLAARVGIEQLAPPLFYEVGSDPPRLRFAVPDDAARLEWITTLVRTARLLLADLPPAHLNGQPTTPVARPTILPLVTDLTDNAELGPRLRRIGQWGRPLCDRPAGAPPLDATAGRILAEARFFFDYLREDYGAALQALDQLEGDATTPDGRRDLMTARAQALLNKGQFRSARRTVDLLQAADRSTGRQIEWTDAGYRLTSRGGSGGSWPHFLAESVAQVEASLVEANPDPAEAAAPPPARDRPGPGPGPMLGQGQGFLFRRYPTPGPVRADPTSGLPRPEVRFPTGDR